MVYPIIYQIGILLISLLIIKILLKLSFGWDHSPTCLIGKTTIVTGANTGIGFYTALDFAKRGARVILACRDKIKAENAKTKIIELTGNPNVIVQIVDFKSLASVRAFAAEIKNTEQKLDILVNNAGASGLENGTTEDGLNILMQVNYFGPALLTLLLIDLLKKSSPSRIVNVASAAAHFANLNPNDLNAWPRFASHIVNYSNSKLCNILFSNELARRLSGSGVTVNSLHPGTVKTEFLRNMPFILKEISEGFEAAFSKSAEEGAQTIIYVAVSKDVDGVTGKYYDNCGIALLLPMPWSARNEAFCKKVWEKTVEHIRLTPEEKLLLSN